MENLFKSQALLNRSTEGEMRTSVSSSFKKEEFETENCKSRKNNLESKTFKWANGFDCHTQRRRCLSL